MSNDSKDLVVFIVRRDTKCSECGQELPRRSLISLEDRRALCLSCADLDHLELLPSGDAALTRRSTKYSRIHAKVVQWSRARKRYERQGILAEPEAIERAMEECLADADLREARRQRERARRAQLDQTYVAEFAQETSELFPNCPPSDAAKIAQHACQKYSGRIGRSARAKQFDPEAIALAVRAYVRHRHTQYDDLLAEGWERLEARHAVGGQVDEILTRWEGMKTLES